MNNWEVFVVRLSSLMVVIETQVSVEFTFLGVRI
jgi:hypothetical protein